mgnify:CR=1 FL=1
MGMLQERGTVRNIARGAGVATGVTGAAALGWTVYSRFFVNHHRRLYSALEAPLHHVRTRAAGRLAYYVDRGDGGPPLVLLHSINAAASSAEMRPLFDLYRGTRTVFSLDLPGFGFSEREPREYTPELYTGAITEFLASEVRAPADIIALSFSSEFAARVALARPELVRSLALISPTGFSHSPRAGAPAFLRTFTVPPFSQAFYDLLVTQRSIRYYLKKSFTGPVDERLARYAYDTAHQPGARHAPLQFLAGVPFTRSVLHDVYRNITVPAVVLYDCDAYVDFGRLDMLLRARGNWRARRIPNTCGLPHFDRPEDTAAALDEFWREVTSAGSRSAVH